MSLASLTVQVTRYSSGIPRVWSFAKAGISSDSIKKKKKKKPATQESSLD
jgi:hypothetical protein